MRALPLEFCANGETKAIGALDIAPGSPWENAQVELFNRRLRNEHLYREEFTSLVEAQVRAAEWRRDRNRRRVSRR